MAMDYDPFYWAIDGYYWMWVDSLNGCPLGESILHGLYGAYGVAGTLGIAFWGASWAGGFSAAGDAAAGRAAYDAANPKPPGWDLSWEWRGCSRESLPGKGWWDRAGGEWRYDAGTNWSHDPHWDYNPWRHVSDGWQNIPLGE